MSKPAKVLGILGGLGPMASVYFYDLITRHTLASRDQDHLDVIVVSGASTPDRTEFITGKSPLSPLDDMKKNVDKLVGAGAELIAVPCNTAQFFFDELSKYSRVPVMNIVRETARHAKEKGVNKLGILATDGTILSGSYSRECDALGMECVVPSAEEQAKLMDIIYKSIKRAESPDTEGFNRIVRSLFDRGCDLVVLGCTELSLIPKDTICQKEKILDSLSVLAKNAITLCGAEPFGFGDIYDI